MIPIVAYSVLIFFGSPDTIDVSNDKTLACELLLTIASMEDTEISINDSAYSKDFLKNYIVRTDTIVNFASCTEADVEPFNLITSYKCEQLTKGYLIRDGVNKTLWILYFAIIDNQGNYLREDKVVIQVH